MNGQIICHVFCNTLLEYPKFACHCFVRSFMLSMIYVGTYIAAVILRFNPPKL